MSDHLGWRRMLDTLRADLQDAEARVAAEDFLALPAFRPPHDLGPLPAALVEEARELSIRHDALIANLAARRRPENRAIAPRPAVRSTARFEVRA